MPVDNDNDYNDDYVAELLKRDAKATSSAASNSGLGSLLNKRSQILSWILIFGH